MKASCLINSHDYIDFVGEAVQSALSQTTAFHEVIVVDDGSRDGSAEFLTDEFADYPNVRVVVKPQAGQLSCFHRGAELMTGDVAFFLDADDVYRSDMLSRALEIYATHSGVDFLSLGYSEFGQPRNKRRKAKPTRDRGITTLASIYNRMWVGNPTSCLSMKSDLLRRVLPFPGEAEWQTRADDVLVFGASLVGGHKYHLDEPLVNYRIHPSNNHARRKIGADEKMAHSLKLNRLIRWYVDKMGYDTRSLAYLLPREFRTWERPTFRELFSYLKMSSRAGVPWHVRVEQAVLMAQHYAAERRATPRGLSSPSAWPASTDRSSGRHPAADASRPVIELRPDPNLRSDAA